MHHDVIVQFPNGISPEDQGHCLLAFEALLRHRTKQDCRVYKAKMADDSKLRVLMTPEERSRT